MLVIHGHGNSRYQYREMMADLVERYDVYCVSPEYRHSGFAANETGKGTIEPYDASHLQVVDCLQAYIELLGKVQVGNPRRSYIWGGSQGGHIALLASAWVPNTFAVTVDCCGSVQPRPSTEKMAERDWDSDDVEIRDASRFAPLITSKVYIVHGDADETVPIDQSRLMEEALRKAGKEVVARYYPGGDHFLRPVTTRLQATIDLADDDLRRCQLSGPNDFERGTRQQLRTTSRLYAVHCGSGAVALEGPLTT
jgi:acetyl esterase/lipase